MKQLSVVIIAFNEAHNISRCISSLQDIADEVILLDSYSTDETAAVAKAMGVKVFYREFSDYVSQKNAALALTRNNWVLSLDADEALTPALVVSIKLALQEPGFVAYECNRLTNYCGKWIKHCGWYPDRKVRLFDKTEGKWAGQKVHEYWQAGDGEAKIGRLEGDLLHFSYSNLSQHIRKTDSFTSYQAENILNQGKMPAKLKLIYKPFWSFFTSYFIRLGFLEGGSGLIISIMAGHSTFAKLAKARMMFEKQRRQSETNPAAEGYTIQ